MTETPEPGGEMCSTCDALIEEAQQNHKHPAKCSLCGEPIGDHVPADELTPLCYYCEDDAERRAKYLAKARA